MLSPSVLLRVIYLFFYLKNLKVNNINNIFQSVVTWMNRCSVKSVGQVCKMSKQELLRKFKEDVTKLRNIAKEANIPDAEVDEIFRNGLAVLRNAQKQMPQKRSSGKFNFISFLKLCLITTMVLLVIYVVLNVHQPTSSIVLRNVQGLIHPGFKFLRLLSVPIITIFPSLTSKLHREPKFIKKKNC